MTAEEHIARAEKMRRRARWGGRLKRKRGRSEAEMHAGFAAAKAQPTATANAGWYPAGDGSLRWWDGERWTEHTAPVSD